MEGICRFKRRQPVILIAEDDDAVRRLLNVVLAKPGRTVLSSVDGLSALEEAERNGLPIDLLVADVGLPRLNGFDLAQQLRQQFPKVEILYVSGYLESDVIEQCLADAGAHFLAKPFSPLRLQEMTQDLLNEGRIGISQWRQASMPDSVSVSAA